VQNVHAQFLCYTSSAYVVAFRIDSSYGYKCNSCINDRHTIVWGMWASIDACRVDLRRIRAEIYHFCLSPLQPLSVFYLKHTKYAVLQKSFCHRWLDGLRTGNSTKSSWYAFSRLKFFWTKIQTEPSVPVNFATVI